MKKKLLLIPVALIAVFSLALASCGSDDSDTADILNFKVGSILPETGGLVFLRDPLINSYRLAVQEINEANAGIVIESFEADSGTDASIANIAADSHIAERVDAVIGAAASSVTLGIIDKLTSQRIAMISGSATSPTLTDYDDGGYFFRTAPPDTLQGQLIAELIIDAGDTSAAIVHRQDDYGVQLAATTRRNLEASGAEVTVIPYDPEAASYDSEAQAVLSSGAEAVVLIAFDEGIKVLSAFLNAGIDPEDIFVTDGLSKDNLGELVNSSSPGVVEGITVTGPSVSPSTEGIEGTFSERLLAFAPDTGDLIFSSHTYDGVIILALAALQAGSTDAEIFRDEVVGITKDGEKCILFAECAALIARGENIDYDGASGRLEFTPAGEPSSGIYDISRYDSEGIREKIGEQELS